MWSHLLSVPTVVLLIGLPANAQTTVSVGPQVLRGIATVAVLPVFPDSSFRLRHFGCAVVQVTVSVEGRATKLRILEAPDDAIAEAVRSAIVQWAFAPILLEPNKTPVQAEGRLIFYFSDLKGRPTVIDAVIDRHTIVRKVPVDQ